MAATIASSVVAKRQSRKSNPIKTTKIYGALRERYEVNIALQMPEDYPEREFLIKSFHGIQFSNPSNYTKDGSGKNARFIGIIKGEKGHYFDNNFYELLDKYGAYNWLEILKKYPTNVSSYEDAALFLREMQDVSPRSVFGLNGAILICGQQGKNHLSNDNSSSSNEDDSKIEIGKIYELYNFDTIEFLNSKNLTTSIVAAPAKTEDIKNLELLLDGNDDSFTLKLENLCLKHNLESSQKLNQILSHKVTAATRNGLDMVDQLIGRHVSSNGTKKPAKGELFVSTATAVGPHGIIKTISEFSGKQWEIKENKSNKEYEIELNNSEYISVFGGSNAIKQRKNGQFFVSKLNLKIIQKNVANVPKTKLIYNATINGKLSDANNGFQWIREGQ